MDSQTPRQDLACFAVEILNPELYQDRLRTVEVVPPFPGLCDELKIPLLPREAELQVRQIVGVTTDPDHPGYGQPDPFGMFPREGLGGEHEVGRDEVVYFLNADFKVVATTDPVDEAAPFRGHDFEPDDPECPLDTILKLGERKRAAAYLVWCVVHDYRVQTVFLYPLADGRAYRALIQLLEAEMAKLAQTSRARQQDLKELDDTIAWLLELVESIG